MDSDCVSVPTAALFTARQPSGHIWLCVWSTDSRGPVSVLYPAPKTSFCSRASRNCAMTVASSGLRSLLSSSRKADSKYPLAISRCCVSSKVSSLYTCPVGNWAMLRMPAASYRSTPSSFNAPKR